MEEKNEEERKRRKEEKERKKQALDSLLKLFQNNRGIHILLVCTFIYILLHRLFEKLISHLLVTPLFSQITSGWGTSFVALVLFLGFSVYAIYKAIRYNYRRNPVRNFLALLLVCFIIYFRWINPAWSFTCFYPSPKFRYIDLLFAYECLIVVLAIIQFVIDIFKKNKIINNALGFAAENPIEKSDQDEFSRNGLAEIMAQKLLHAPTRDCAFAMGVCGEWGAGKTSFCNLILQEIAKPENQNESTKVEIVKFNPWLSKDKNSLIGSFFDQLSDQLKKYDSCLSHELLAYGKLLSGIFRQSPIDPKSLAQLLQPEQNLNEYFDSINQAIAKAKLQLIVFFDDLDRLLYDEVPEVLKLIRNSANFNHTCFLVAYDKNYIVEALRSHKVHNPTVFLEKIFQYDFVLPPINPSQLHNILLEKIKVNCLLNDDQKRDLSDYFAYNTYKMGASIGLALDLIKQMRDVNRLVNSLSLSIEFI